MRTLPVDVEELVIAFETEATDFCWYLDLQTGAVILVGRDYEPAEQGGLTKVEIETDPTRFVPVPVVSSEQVVADMRFFAESLQDGQLKESLELALQAARPTRRFKTALSWLPEQEARWHTCYQSRCLDRAISWLASLGLSATTQAA